MLMPYRYTSKSSRTTAIVTINATSLTRALAPCAAIMQSLLISRVPSAQRDFSILIQGRKLHLEQSCRPRSRHKVEGRQDNHHLTVLKRCISTQKVQRRLPASYYRGGTSRAVMFNRNELPADQADWVSIFRGVIGSPDPENGRQLDGLGGGISSLSKICVIEALDPQSDKDAADVNYTFVQIGVRNNEVDCAGNCGNMTSAVGPFAIDTGLVVGKKSNEHGEVTIRIRNTNTNKIIDSTFPLSDDGMAASYGDFAIDGVAGTAAKVRLAFLDPAGSKTGQMLPTGSAVDTFDGVPATCIDVGNPCVFVSAFDLDIAGDVAPDAIEAHPNLLQRLESIRRQAAVQMGICRSLTEVPGSIPKVAMVSSPSEIAKDPSDVVVRAISVGQPHRAIPITVAMAVSAAANINGSTVQKVCTKQPVDPDGTTIGHPTGRLLVGARFEGETGDIKDATVFRTSRLLMRGDVYWKD